MKNPYEGGAFRVSQPFTYKSHNGIDIVGVSSKTMLSICDGTVYQSRIVTNKNDLTWQWGNYVTLKADTGELITYAHLSQRLVEKGKRVKIGDKIGIEGNTGYSFGSHCHLEVRNSANIVTKEINTPIYTQIPNAVGRYTVKEVDAMTDAEKAYVKALEMRIANLEATNRVWRYWDDIKENAPWAYPPLWAMYQAGYFAGASPSDLNLTNDAMKTIVILARVLKDKGEINY